jgi:uncharacterized protein (DUF1015 family)
LAKMHAFRALRPPASKVAEISCPPYDVISTDEARAMAHGKPESFLHVIRPEIDLPPEIDVHADEVYARGRENLEKAIRELPLTFDDKPELYVYRLTMGGRPQVGVVGCCSVDEYDQDLIRKHERTRPDKEDDRTRHVVEMSCQAEPIFLAYRDVAAIDALVGEAMKGHPVYDFTSDDGVGHTLWRMPDPAAVSAAFEAVPLLYVADGHHRSASASRARAHFKAKNPKHIGDEEYNRVLSVVFPAGQLRILPYNRTVKDLRGRSVEQFLQELGKVAPLTPDAAAAPPARGEFRVLVKQDGALRWYGFSLKPGAGASVIDALDVSLLQDRVLAPLLGIDDPRRSDRIDFVGGIRGTAELEKLVREGRAAVAFSLYPTSLEELMAVADANEIMPPKSTWFEPKLRSGLFLHRI